MSRLDDIATVALPWILAALTLAGLVLLACVPVMIHNDTRARINAEQACARLHSADECVVLLYRTNNR